MTNPEPLIIHAPELDTTHNPLLTKQENLANNLEIYKFLKLNKEYRTNPQMNLNDDTKQFLLDKFPTLDITHQYRPDNIGWYTHQLDNKISLIDKTHNEKIKKRIKSVDTQSNNTLESTNEKDLKSTESTEAYNPVLEAKKKKAVDLMILVNKVLLENGIEPRLAQELSFNTVNKALDKNPNLTLSQDLDISQNQDLSGELREGIRNKFGMGTPKPKSNTDEENKFAGRKDLTEENAKELQNFMTNKMISEFENYKNSNAYNMQFDDKNYRNFALDSATETGANTSLSLKANIAAMRGELGMNNSEKNYNKTKKLPPTPMDELLDPIKK